MDNLGIVSDRIVENTKVNPRKYGLVKQLGPYDITPADMYNAHLPPTKPRRQQFFQPDATPLGVDDDLARMPVLLGGGFSMENGSVVQEAIYDARITAPGQKVRGMPMEGPGVLKAIQSIMGSSQTLAPSMPGQMAPTTQPMAIPTNPDEPITRQNPRPMDVPPPPAAPAAPAPPAAPASNEPTFWLLDLSKERWPKLSLDRKFYLIANYAAKNTEAFFPVIPLMSRQEKTLFDKTLQGYQWDFLKKMWDDITKFLK